LIIEDAFAEEIGWFSSAGSEAPKVVAKREAKQNGHCRIIAVDNSGARIQKRKQVGSEDATQKR